MSGARRITSRRRFLALTAGAGALAGLGGAGCAELTTVRAGSLLTSQLPLPEPFAVPLPIPPLAQPTDGRAAYALTQQIASAEIIPGTRTEQWGYDGVFPGPTFDVRRGQPIRITMTNELPVPTSTHLHGGVTPDDFDGYPTHLVRHGDAFSAPPDTAGCRIAEAGLFTCVQNQTGNSSAEGGG